MVRASYLVLDVVSAMRTFVSYGYCGAFRLVGTQEAHKTTCTKQRLNNGNYTIKLHRLSQARAI